MTYGSTNGVVQPCKYCKKVKVTWDYKVKNIPKPDGNGFYKGYWKEVDANLQPTGEVHTFERCKAIQEGTVRVEEFKENQTPVGQSTLPQSVSSSMPSSVSTPKLETGTKIESSTTKPETKQIPQKVDPELLSILRKCGELEETILIVAKEIWSNNQSHDLQKIADRLLSIYLHKKTSERQDITIKILQQIDVALSGLSKQ